MILLWTTNVMVLMAFVNPMPGIQEVSIVKMSSFLKTLSKFEFLLTFGLLLTWAKC